MGKADVNRSKYSAVYRVLAEKHALHAVSPRLWCLQANVRFSPVCVS